MGQNIFDIAILLILSFFTIRGYITGLIGEIAAIASLVGGFWVAHTFHADFAPYLTFLHIREPIWLSMASYVLLFIGVVIAVAIIAKILQKILDLAFVSWLDRLGGSLLGLAKGIILCSIVFVVFGKFCANSEFYIQSRTRPYFASFIDGVRSSLPQDIVEKFNI